MNAYASAQDVWAAALVFARIGALVMLIPGIGDATVPPRIRLSFAFLLSLALTPVVAQGVPPLPGTVSGLATRVILEVLIGLMIGGILRVFMAALAVAGEIVSLQTSLSFSQTANPAQAQPGTSIASFLAVLGVALIMATGLHHSFLAAMVQSYQVFPFAKPVPVNDAGALAVRTVGGAFALGVQLSAPVIVFSLVFNIATGLIGRAMPQFQIFFAAAPLQILLGLAVFALSLGAVGMVWVGRYRDLLAAFS